MLTFPCSLETGAHHTVLVDDSNFSADQLQPLVFNLCFTCTSECLRDLRYRLQLTMPLSTDAKATRAVSVPTPAFYASRRTSLESPLLDASKCAYEAIIEFAVCTRAQLLLSQEDDRTTVISSTSDSSQERMRQRALIEAQGRLKVSWNRRTLSQIDFTDPAFASAQDIHPAHSERLFFL